MTGTSARGRRGCLNEATREELDQSEDAHEIVGVVVGGVAVLRCLSRGACPMVPVPRRAAASSPCLSHAAAACLSQARACPTPLPVPIPAGGWTGAHACPSACPVPGSRSECLSQGMRSACPTSGRPTSSPPRVPVPQRAVPKRAGRQPAMPVPCRGRRPAQAGACPTPSMPVPSNPIRTRPPPNQPNPDPRSETSPRRTAPRTPHDPRHLRCNLVPEGPESTTLVTSRCSTPRRPRSIAGGFSRGVGAETPRSRAPLSFLGGSDAPHARDRLRTRGPCFG